MESNPNRPIQMDELTLINVRWKDTLRAVRTPHFMATLHTAAPSTPPAWLQDVSELITLCMSAAGRQRKRQGCMLSREGHWRATKVMYRGPTPVGGTVSVVLRSCTYRNSIFITWCGFKMDTVRACLSLRLSAAPPVWVTSHGIRR